MCLQTKCENEFRGVVRFIDIQNGLLLLFSMFKNIMIVGNRHVTRFMTFHFSFSNQFYFINI